MEELVAEGKWFKIKDEGVWYWCMIKLKWSSYSKEYLTYVTIITKSWFRKQISDECAIWKNFHIFKVGEYWYTLENAKYLFKRAKEEILQKEIEALKTKAEYHKIKSVKTIE